MADYNFEGLTKVEALTSSGQPVVGATTTGTVPSTGVAQWLKDTFQDLDVGSMVGGAVGGALGTLPPALATSGGWSPYMGGAAGAAGGQFIQDLLQGKTNLNRTLLSGGLGAVGPGIGKTAMGLGSVLKGTTQVMSQPNTIQQEIVKQLARMIPTAGATAWGSYASGGNPLMTGLAGLAGASIPPAISFGRAMQKVGAWNPYASGIATGLTVDPVGSANMLADTYGTVQDLFETQMTPQEQAEYLQTLQSIQGNDLQSTLRGAGLSDAVIRALQGIQ
jgi:hypothetical protein